MARNLTLGKGELHFAKFNDNLTQLPGGYRFLGNCPEFNLTVETESLDHYSSTGGIRVKDDEVTLEITTSGTISCDDADPKNVALFFLGSESTIAQGALTGETDTFEGVQQGLGYQLGERSTSPSGKRNVSAVVVEPAGGGTAFVLDTDYTVDLTLGIITIIEGGGIDNDDDIDVTYDVAISSRSQVVTGTSQVEGALKFISYNPKGPRVDYFFPWVKLSPNGDFNLITEEWLTIPLNVTALQKGDLAVLYADGRPA
jgi:hypothetical protein